MSVRFGIVVLATATVLVACGDSIEVADLSPSGAVPEVTTAAGNDPATPPPSLAPRPTTIASPALSVSDTNDARFESAADLFERARTLDNFAGFYFDPPTNEHVLTVQGDTADADALVDAFPANQVRVEQATFSFAELRAVADMIVPVDDDTGRVVTSQLVEPFATLVDQGHLGVGIRQSFNRIEVFVDNSVPDTIVDQIRSIIGDYGVVSRGRTNEETGVDG